MTTRTITVPEIHCEHCKSSIEGALGPIAGVHTATVDVAARQVTVDFEPDTVTPEALVEAIEEQGYDVPAQG